MNRIVLLHIPSVSLSAAVEPTITATWVKFVKTGEEHSGIGLNEELESFLVFSLIRHTKRTDLFCRELGVEYLRASTQLTGKNKECLLQEVGDRGLLLAGLYHERHRRLNVSSSYFSDMGRLAYADLVELYALKKLHGLETLYRNVEKSFPLMTRVLSSARGEKFNLETKQQIIKKPGFLTPK